MKAKTIILLLLLETLVLSACASPSDDHKTDNDDKKYMNQLSLPADAELLSFNNGDLFYFMDKTTDSKDDLFADKVLYSYSIKNNQKKQLADLKHISYATASVALSKGKLYLPCQMGDHQNELFEIDIDKSTVDSRLSWTADTVFSYIFSSNDKLVLFCIDAINAKDTEYSIRVIDIENDEVTVIAKQIANSEYGTAISSIDVDNGYIYAFLVSNSKGTPAYSIEKYDLKGNVCDKINLKLEHFLEYTDINNKEDQETDMVFDLYVGGEYFILNTINGRVNIFEQEEGEVHSIDVPKEMYEKFPSSYKYLSSLGNGRSAYFVNAFTGHHTLYLFDYSMGKFTPIDFPYNSNCMYFYVRNQKGDLVIKVIDMAHDDQTSYYYLDSEKLSRELQ